jgi:hypothetical protein
MAEDECSRWDAISLRHHALPKDADKIKHETASQLHRFLSLDESPGILLRMRQEGICLLHMSPAENLGTTSPSRHHVFRRFVVLVRSI